MSLILKLPQVLQESREAFEKLMDGEDAVPFRPTELVSGGDGIRDPEAAADFNMLALGDNLDFMAYLLKERGMEGKINLIYVDPPFFSKSDYGSDIRLKSDKIEKIPIMRQKAYHDTWENGMEEYLKMLALRFFLMHRLLAGDGSLFVHLDWHAVHYVKILLDEIFGAKNFVNEVIWQYKSGGASRRCFARKHDNLLFYGKTRNYYFKPMQEKSYNRGFKPYRFKGVKEYRDETGWYTMVNRKDVWQLDMVGRTAAERTGYATQKPEALLLRILESCSREGDLCADFFAGSGTLPAAASQMGRRWIACDAGRLACASARKRLAERGAGYCFYEKDPDAGDRAGKGKAPKEGRNQIDAKVELAPASLSQQHVLKVTLTGYRLGSLTKIPVESKYLPAIRNILRRDSLQFVSFWSVDAHYDGQVFRPQAWFGKVKDEIETVYQDVGSGIGPVAIRVTDVFGGGAFTVLTPPDQGSGKLPAAGPNARGPEES